MKQLTLLLTSLFFLSIVFISCEDDNDPNMAPVANAGDSQQVYEGETVTLDASSSYDEDGYSISYAWTAPNGVTLSSGTDAQTTFTAPEVTEDTEYLFTLTVNNGGLSTEATVSVNVLQSDIAYVINYGSYGNGSASISRYNLETGTITNNFYEEQNSEINLELTSNLQSAYQANGNFYLMANSSDGVIVVDDQFVQSIDAVSDQIAKPRNAVAYGDYLYISCLGDSPDWNEMPDTYIAKLDLTTNTVEETIALPGGPEGMAIANGNLYVALNYKKSIAVISLSDNSISYIETPAVTSYFIKDSSDNLYVSMVSTYTYSSDSPGLGYINTTTNTLEDTYYLDGVSSNYSSVMSANSDLSTIYLLASSWVELEDGSWVLQGAAQQFDVATGTFSTFVDNLSGVNGITVNPENDNEIYIFGGESGSEGGYFDIYDASGALQTELTCGISPYWVLFLDK